MECYNCGYGTLQYSHLSLKKSSAHRIHCSSSRVCSKSAFSLVFLRLAKIVGLNTNFSGARFRGVYFEDVKTKARTSTLSRVAESSTLSNLKDAWAHPGELEVLKNVCTVFKA
jgi:hypothetical protein